MAWGRMTKGIKVDYVGLVATRSHDVYLLTCTLVKRKDENDRVGIFFTFTMGPVR